MTPDSQTPLADENSSDRKEIIASSEKPPQTEHGIPLSTVEEFRHELTGILGTPYREKWPANFYNAFIFSNGLDENEGLVRFESAFQNFQEIDRKLAICYPELETRITLCAEHHRFPFMRQNLRLILTAGFRINPSHGYYNLHHEILYHQKRRYFYAQPGDTKNCDEMVDFLTSLFDELKS